MTNRLWTSACAAALLLAMPVAVLAQSRGRGFDFRHDLNPPALPQLYAVVARPPVWRNPGPVVANPQAARGSWWWNHYLVWHPSPAFWGGGFWGELALADLGLAPRMGSVVDDQQHPLATTFGVERASPGAQLLQDYGLQQAVCGPPDLAIIWGPQNGVVCANPTATIVAGDSLVDPAAFTLVPQTR
jgi:hypothetical protein